MTTEIQRILGLAQIEQQSPQWHEARKNKQSASDFGAVVPRTSTYIQHIVDRWQSDDLKKSAATCYEFGKEEYYLRKVHYPKDTSTTTASVGFTGSACARGHQFEPVLRHLTSQHLGLTIVEMGWVEGQHTPHAGVSPDGLVLDNTRYDEVSSVPHEYIFEHGSIRAHQSGFACDGPKNFEAKTIVSRPMNYKVPLKYHIQVERTAYELGVRSSIYSEAKFTILHEKTWHQESSASITATSPHLHYGIMISDQDTYIHAPQDVISPTDFDTWAQKKIHDVPHGICIYFRLDAFWCVEIPLWSSYHDVYGPLIASEAEKIHWFATTPEGRLAYDALLTQKKQRATTRKTKAAPDPAFLQQLQQQIALA